MNDSYDSYDDDDQEEYNSPLYRMLMSPKVDLIAAAVIIAALLYVVVRGLVFLLT